ncbi:lytic transglycosylase domain-containing protein, partial [Micromonospora zhanjiangensis]
DGPVGTPTPGLPGAGAGRPADVLGDWARQVGTRAGIPQVAMQAYGYAELVLGQTKPQCRLTWTTLAAIGQVESNHGAVRGGRLSPDGLADPPIIGLPLDGTGGRQKVADTDLGALDGDPTYDRALGPMQFIPGTWRTSGVDADNDGQKNPQNIYDSALAAGNYLCSGDRNLSVAQDWWNAILSYNDVQTYAESVYQFANVYGSRSRT